MSKQKEQMEDLICMRELQGIEQFFPKSVNSHSFPEIQLGKKIIKSDNYSLSLGRKNIRIY